MQYSNIDIDHGPNRAVEGKTMITRTKFKRKFLLNVFLLLLMICLPAGLFSQLAVGVSGDLTINKCEIKQYTISIENNSGNPLTALQITGQLGNFTGGWTYYYNAGTHYSVIDVEGTPMCNGGGDNSEPVISGTDLIWNIDTRCPNDAPFTLPDGDTLNISFWLQTDCDAVSGSLNVQFDYEISGTPTSDNTGAMSIQVNPGAVNIRKEPNVIPQVLGQNVTWTIEVENSGLGVIENVEVTDILGAGLQYVSSTPASSTVTGGPGGETIIWDSGDVPALASMNPGDVVSIDITATVIACDNLDNVADARWGCNPSPSNTCYNTASDGGTARAAVQRIPRTPLIDYTPPNITFNYCQDYVDVSFPVNNIGDGIAYDVWTIIDFPGLTVSNVSAGATYNTGAAPPDGPRFEITNPIAPGGSYTLSFRLTASDWCGSPLSASDLLWQKVYKDECDNLFYPPVELSQITAPAGSTGLSVGKSVVGGFTAIQIGTTISYDVTSAYSGDTSCGSPAGNAGLVTVTDTVPAGFTVTGAGGGVWTPGGGGTGGTIVWTYTPPASLNTTITLQAPGVGDCETYCNTTFTNSIAASGTDCCGCALNASDSVTVAIECEEGVDSEKSASPTTGERCGQITYTNTYRFDDVAGNDSINVSSLVFTEQAEYEQEYIPATLSVTVEDLSGGGQVSATACATTGITNTTPGPGGTFQVDFSGCGSFGTVRNKEIIITYTLLVTTDTVTACEGRSFYSWSELDMGPTGSDCLANGIIHETAYVSIQPPAMSVSINNMNPILHKCEAQSIDIVLTQTSTATDAKDVRLVLSGLNYYVTDVPGVTGSGVTPTSGNFVPTPVGDDYVWYFGDNFSSGSTTSTITLNVRKKCTPGGELTATAYFDDTCNDQDAPDVYNDSCNVAGSASPSLLLSGDLLIEKTPETYYASDNTVQWKIYVTNRGTGTAYNVWVDDVMGSGLTFGSATVDGAADWTVNPNVDHEANAINGANITIDSIPAGIRREITFNATYSSCVNLTNNVTANWGCVGDLCQTDVTDSSTVSIPAPLVVHTNVVDTPVNACDSPQGYITIKNAGQITAYNFQVTETLPAGLLYKADTTRWRVYSGGSWGGWNGPSAGLYNPNPTSSPIQWTSAEIAGLAELGPGERIEIEFDFDADCPFNGGTVTLATQYENPCGQVFNNADSNFTVAIREPDVEITKTANNDVLGCTDAVTWTIDVTNNSTYMLEAIWLEDTMGDVYTYTGSTGDATYTGDNGTNAGQVTVWEIRNLPAGSTATVTISASTDGPGGGGCNSDMDNTVRAWWGCGAVDGLSTTKPGQVGVDSDKCLTANLPTEETNTPTREPTVDFLGTIGLNPASIDSCNDSTEMTVTIDNAGRTDSYDLDLVITLPANLTYNANSVELCTGVDDSCVVAPIAEPVITPGAGGTQVLTFYDLGDKASDIVNQLQAAGGTDTIVLKFDVATLCYTTADIDFDLYFYDCCGNNQYTTNESITLTADYPQLAITKTPATGQIDCASGSQEWVFTVTNNGTGNAQVVRVEDVPGAWLTMQMGTFNDVDGTGASIADLDGGTTYGWEFTDLAAGNSVEFRVSTALNPNYGLPPQTNCNEIYRQNTATAVWGCGTAGHAVDLNAATTAYDCTDALPASLASNPTLLMPNLEIAAITPINLTCTADGTFSGSIRVQVTNSGDGVSTGNFDVSIDDGQGFTASATYSGGPISAGSTVNVDISGWTPACQPCGSPFQFVAQVDTGAAICECDESDNDNSGTPVSYSVDAPDLEITGSTIGVACSGTDGQITVSGSLDLINNGCVSTFNTNIPIRVTLYNDTNCQAGSGSVVGTFDTTLSGISLTANGGTQPRPFTGNITADICSNTTFSVRVQLDPNDIICECDGTNNDYCTNTLTPSPPNIPDIEVTGDNITVACNSDGVVRFTGTLEFTNSGIGTALNTSVPVRFSLYGNTNCGSGSGSVIHTWTDSIAVNVNAGSSGSFGITLHDYTADLPALIPGSNVSLYVEADYNSTICECNGGNNDYCVNKFIDIPDVEIISENLEFTCTTDGNFEVSGTVTVRNNGSGNPLTDNLDMRFRVYDDLNCNSGSGFQVAQWNETFTTVSIPVTPGSNTQTFTINNYTLPVNICSASTGWNASIRIEADYTDLICESNGTNNEFCGNKSVQFPDLTVSNVGSTVTCLGDGSLTGTTVTVTNTGNAAATNAVVRLTSDCGLTFTDQTVTVAAGASEDVFFAFTAGITDCSCTFSAEVDPDNLICECDGSNNTNSSVASMLIPDLEVQDQVFNVTCSDDGVVQVTGTVTVVNNGCGPNFTDSIPVRFSLYGSRNGGGTRLDQWTATLTGVDIPPAGGTRTFNIPVHQASMNLCTDSTSGVVSVYTELDYNNTICEWDGTDNTATANVNVVTIDVEAVEMTATADCQSDGTYDNRLELTVRNNGGSPVTDDFYISVDDGQGWTTELRYNADLNGVFPLASGAEATVTFEWNRTFAVSDCTFPNITATVDSRNQLCQCTVDNDVITTSITQPTPNLKPTAIEPSCAGDGTYMIVVTVENDGCGPAGTFTVNLKDNLGNTADMTTTEPLAAGQSTNVTFNDWPATCEPNSVTFTASIDSNSDVCESDGPDNTMVYTFTNPSPDLVFTQVRPSADCSSDGQLKGVIDVTMQNNGNAAVTEDFKIIVNDGQGWSTERFYQSELGGSLPIAVGATATARVNWTRDFAKEPFTCNFNNISVSIDPETNVCECAAGNNETVVSYKLPYPDIDLEKLECLCEEEGNWKMKLTVSNNGCEDLNEEFQIKFSDTTGESRTESFTAIGGTLPLKAGAAQELTLNQWPVSTTNKTISYTVEVLAGTSASTYCDLNTDNNTLTGTLTLEAPELYIDEVTWETKNDGTVKFKVIVGNSGTTSASAVPFTVYDNSGKPVYNDTVNLPPGSTKTLTFTAGPYTAGETIDFRFVIDGTNEYCEFDETNNEKTTPVTIEQGGGEPGIELTLFCPPGQQQGGLFRFEVQVRNTGTVALYNTIVKDFLPEGFQYVDGSAVLNGQPQIDPAQQGDHLAFDIGVVNAGSTSTLVFTAVADADIDPGRYCNEAMVIGNIGSSDGAKLSTERWQCCTVVTRKAGAGCCLDVEEWPLAPMRRPEGPVSFIEPYFHTESSMFTVYAALNLWKDSELEKGKMPRFIKERMRNYARSTVEEFYFNSRLGFTMPDGTLWLSHAGAYPEKDGNNNDNNNNNNHNDDKAQWARKQVDETMTVSQVGFELLALNETSAIETDKAAKGKMKEIIERKLAFIGFFIDEELPHGWELDSKKQEKDNKKNVEVEEAAKWYVKKTDASATLYDRTVLYLSMVELQKAGYKKAGPIADALRKTLKQIDNEEFDRDNIREELMFMMALLKNGEGVAAKTKLEKLEALLDAQKTGEGGEVKDVLDGLHNYGLAIHVSRVLGGTLHDKLEAKLKEKYYMSDTGILAEKQPDFTFKLNLENIAPVVLAFGSDQNGNKDENATVLYRTFDEVGLFLKKRNLSVGKPLYSILKNYPFTQPLLPVLSFTKANRGIAPVFSRDAVVHSTQVKPLGEVLIPGSFSKILSPSYETGTARVARTAFGLQYVGRLLKQKDLRVHKEEGRSLDSAGMKYIDSLLHSGAGVIDSGMVLLPFDNVAVKGPKKADHNLEPLNSGYTFTSATLADFMTAERLYVEGKGKHAEAVHGLMKKQAAVVAKFKEAGYVPRSFKFLVNEETGDITVIPSTEKASKLTIAKLMHGLPGSPLQSFLEEEMKKTKGKLETEDMIFLSAAAEFVSYFKEEIAEIIAHKDSYVSYNAADIIGRRLVGSDEGELNKSLENLLSHWDKEAYIPKSDNIETIEKGSIYRHDPRHILLYLLATQERGDFRFKRTLNFFSYLLENEWGVESDNSFITLPSSEYRVFMEEPKKDIEPGDLLTFRVLVDNTCPDGFGNAHDLSSLFLKAAFSPPLVYAGTEKVDGLEVLGDFKWHYDGLVEGDKLEFSYQAIVPRDFKYDTVNGWIYAGSRQGMEEFGPGTAIGDKCEDIDNVQKLNFVPFAPLQGMVYDDKNVNGVKDVGETGIPNIQLKDTRGRVFRTDAEGRFTVLAGKEHEGVQIELKELPSNYLLVGSPTRMVNRYYTGDISFGLVECKTVKGFVYVDENNNGVFDEGEARPRGVVLKAKDKEVVSGKDGGFVFRNLPALWQQWIEISKDQPFYKGSLDNLEFEVKE